MVTSFEEVAETSPEETSDELPLEILSLVNPIALAGVLIYLSITVFAPYILSDQLSATTVPFFFSGLFFVATLGFLFAWVGWVLLKKKLSLTLGVKDGWPLLAVPLSIGLFYLFGLSVGWFSL